MRVQDGPAIRRVRADVMWTVVGLAALALGQWAIIAVTARLSNPATVGRLALALAIAGPVFACSNVGLRMLAATDARSDHPVAAYRRLRGRTACTAALLVALLGLWAGVAPLLLAAVIALRVADAGSDLAYGLMHRETRFGRAARSMLARGVLAPLCSAVLLLSGADIGTALAGVAATWWLSFLLLDAASLVGGPSAGAPVRPLLRQAAPLAALHTLYALYPYLPVYFLHARSEAEAGLFTAAYFLLAGIGMIATSVAQALVPRMSGTCVEQPGSVDRRLMIEGLGIITVVALAGIVVAAAAGERVLTMLYTPEYASSRPALLWLMGAGLPAGWAMFLTLVAVSQRKLRSVAITSCAVALLLTGACAALVPRHGVVGASAAVALAFLAQAAGAAAIVGRGRR